MAVPTLIQRVTSAQDTTVSDGSMKLSLPNPTGANNCIVVCVQSGTTVTGPPTVADNIGTNTYSTGPDIVGGQRVTMLFALGVAAGTQNFTISFTGATANFTQVDIAEFYNIATSAASDGSSTKNAGTNTSPANTGAITTASDGDLILSYFADETTAPPTAITGFTAGAGMTLISANPVVGSAFQYGIQATHGAITPQITIAGGADSFVAVGLALKSAAAGTPPAPGMRVVGVQHVPVYSSVTTNTKAVQFPCVGNLIAASILTFTNASAVISSITDTKSNSWAGTGAAVGSGSPNTELEIWRADNSTPDTALTITFNWSANVGGIAGGDTHIVLYDIVGAATSPFDVRATATGNQTSAGNLSTVSITPLTANGVIICMGDIDAHTASGVTGSVVSDICVTPLMDGGGNDLDEDALWAHFYNPDTTSTTFTFTIQHNTAGVLLWGTVAAAFKAAAPQSSRAIGSNVFHPGRSPGRAPISARFWSPTPPWGSIAGIVTFSASLGVYTWKGDSSPVTKIFAAAVGAYTWAGKSSPLSVEILATKGAWTWAGKASPLSTSIAAARGAWTWAGRTSPVSKSMNAGPGAWTWAGVHASFVSPMNAAVGAYSWAGRKSPLSASFASGVGVYVWSGRASVVTVPGGATVFPWLDWGRHRGRR